jgi:hypothetical protein
MFSNGIKLSFVIIVILSLLLSIVTISASFAGISAAQKREVTLTTILDDQGDPPRLLKMLFEPALKQLQARHPDLDIKLDYRPIPYVDLHPSHDQ